MIIFLLWLGLSFVVAGLGSDKKIGYWGVFAISILLSPIVGIIVGLVAAKKELPAPVRVNNIPAQKVPKKNYQLIRYESLIEKGMQDEKRGNKRRALSNYMDAEKALEHVISEEQDETLTPKLEELKASIQRLKDQLFSC